jgi:hypothetical protein
VQGLDRYAYVNNNPVRYNDPSGHTYCDFGKCQKVNPPISSSNNDDPNDSNPPFDPSLGGNASKFGSEPNDNSQNNNTITNLPVEKSSVYINGKVIGIVFVELVLVVPTEYVLINLSITTAAGGPPAWILEIPITALEVIVADLGISLGIQARETLVTGQDVEFQWTIIPDLVSDLPTPIQNELHDYFPGVIP